MTAKRQGQTQKKKAAKRQKSKQAKEKIAKKAGEGIEPGAKDEKFEVQFYRDWCKGCGICAAFCPTQAISMNDKGKPEITKRELCIGCAWCEMRCPDFAVRVKKTEEEQVCEA